MADRTWLYDAARKNLHVRVRVKADQDCIINVAPGPEGTPCAAGGGRVGGAKVNSAYQKPLVLIVGPDPEPYELALAAQSKSAISWCNPDRPKWTNRLQAERGMERVMREKSESLVSFRLYILGQSGVTLPEARQGLGAKPHTRGSRRRAKPS
jgi:hypothetical protein